MEKLFTKERLEDLLNLKLEQIQLETIECEHWSTDLTDSLNEDRLSQEHIETRVNNKPYVINYYKSKLEAHPRYFDDADRMYLNAEERQRISSGEETMPMYDETIQALRKECAKYIIDIDKLTDNELIKRLILIEINEVEDIADDEEFADIVDNISTEWYLKV